ncbi:MAG: hypothetical protein P8Z72_10385 [Gammaproteobacteria bacterium]
MYRYLPVLTAVMLTAACSSVPAPVTSPYYQIPSGSKLVLKQTLTIPPNTASVYIQYGKVVSPQQKDNFYAHCWFTSWYVRDQPQLIKPDTFTITHSQQFEDVVSRGQSHMLAMNGPVTGVYDGGPMALDYSTVMYIHSDKQPAIRRFGCGYWENPDDAQHLTVAEMQKVLGSIARIELKKDQQGPVSAR